MNFLRLQRPVGLWGRTIILSSLVGVLAGLAAVALETGLDFGAELVIGRFADLGGPEIFTLRWELLLLPALGGLLSGVIVQLIAGHAPGHGTDQMVHAFHRQDGHFSLKAPTVKASAAIGVISFGGSAGPEGPIAALGAAIGSKTARLAGLTPRDRRVLLLAGCAASVGALFGCPLGGALFAAGILYREPEFEGSALVSAFIASVFGYSTYVSLLGFGAHLLRGSTGLHFRSPWELPIYAVLGLACGLTAVFFSASFFFVERQIKRLSPIPLWLRPAVGGLLTGAVACVLPQVMDGRYEFVGRAFDGSLMAGAATGTTSAWFAWAALLGVIALAKCVATAFTVGSGAAGGVLGPSVAIGGMVGASLGAFVTAIAPDFMSEALRQALIAVGMAGVLAASMRTPLAAMVIVMEMTGSFGLIVPLMLAAMTAYIVGSGWGLIDAQVDSPADSPAHAGGALAHVLERNRVGDVMRRDWPLRARPSTPVSELLDELQEGVSACVPVVEDDRLVGVIALPELHHLLEGHLPSLVIAADIMSERPFCLNPEHSLYEAVTAFEEWHLDVIPVVAGQRGEAGRLLGMLTRQAVVDLVERHMDTTRDQFLHEHAAFAAIQEQDQITRLLGVLPSTPAGTVMRVPVDEELEGRTLASADFRNVRRAEVLAIQTRDHVFICPPDPRRVLERGDDLLVIVPAGEGAKS